MSAHRHDIGGQALIEGVMMRSPRWWAVAVRRPDGAIHSESHELGTLAQRRPVFGRPLLRGVIAIGEAMSVGMRALSIAAHHAAGDDETPNSREIVIALIVAFVFFVGVFVILPAVLVPARTDQRLLRNVIEGGVRIALFLGYILAISRLSDIKRVFQYHGAEHKTIAAQETGATLDLDGVRPFSTVHVRCGTNFLFLVMLLSVAVFSLVGRDPLWWRLVSRIVLIPVVAGVSYEVLRISARHPRNPLVRLVAAPGLWLQRVTTREPDDDQLEVALAAMEELLSREAPDAG